MSLTTDEVRKIAQLARIEVAPSEEARLAETISAVLDYMKILNEVNTDRVVPTFQVAGLENVIRDDTPIDSSSELRLALLKQMPALEMDELVVPGVFNGD